MWQDVFWVKLKGWMWRVIKNMYEASRSAILLEWKKLTTFRVEEGVAQNCILAYSQFYFQC